MKLTYLISTALLLWAGNAHYSIASDKSTHTAVDLAKITKESLSRDKPAALSSKDSFFEYLDHISTPANHKIIDAAKSAYHAEPRPFHAAKLVAALDALHKSYSSVGASHAQLELSIQQSEQVKHQLAQAEKERRGVEQTLNEERSIFEKTAGLSPQQRAQFIEEAKRAGQVALDNLRQAISFMKFTGDTDEDFIPDLEGMIKIASAGVKVKADFLEDKKDNATLASYLRISAQKADEHIERFKFTQKIDTIRALLDKQGKVFDDALVEAEKLVKSFLLKIEELQRDSKLPPRIKDKIETLNTKIDKFKIFQNSIFGRITHIQTKFLQKFSDDPIKFKTEFYYYITIENPANTEVYVNAIGNAPSGGQQGPAIGNSLLDGITYINTLMVPEVRAQKEAQSGDRDVETFLTDLEAAAPRLIKLFETMRASLYAVFMLVDEIIPEHKKLFTFKSKDDKEEKYRPTKVVDLMDGFNGFIALVDDYQKILANNIIMTLATSGGVIPYSAVSALVNKMDAHTTSIASVLKQLPNVYKNNGENKRKWLIPKGTLWSALKDSILKLDTVVVNTGSDIPYEKDRKTDLKSVLDSIYLLNNKFIAGFSESSESYKKLLNELKDFANPGIPFDRRLKDEITKPDSMIKFIYERSADHNAFTDLLKTYIGQLSMISHSDKLAVEELKKVIEAREAHKKFIEQLEGLSIIYEMLLNSMKPSTHEKLPITVKKKELDRAIHITDEREFYLNLAAEVRAKFYVYNFPIFYKPELQHEKDTLWPAADLKLIQLFNDKLETTREAYFNARNAIRKVNPSGPQIKGPTLQYGGFDNSLSQTSFDAIKTLISNWATESFHIPPNILDKLSKKVEQDADKKNTGPAGFPTKSTKSASSGSPDGKITSQEYNELQILLEKCESKFMDLKKETVYTSLTKPGDISNANVLIDQMIDDLIRKPLGQFIYHHARNFDLLPVKLDQVIQFVQNKCLAADFRPEFNTKMKDISTYKQPQKWRKTPSTTSPKDAHVSSPSSSSATSAAVSSASAAVSHSHKGMSASPKMTKSKKHLMKPEELLSRQLKILQDKDEANRLKLLKDVLENQLSEQDFIKLADDEIIKSYIYFPGEQALIATKDVHEKLNIIKQILHEAKGNDFIKEFDESQLLAVSLKELMHLRRGDFRDISDEDLKRLSEYRNYITADQIRSYKGVTLIQHFMMGKNLPAKEK